MLMSRALTALHDRVNRGVSARPEHVLRVLSSLRDVMNLSHNRQ
jgi:hypothetical protein